MQTNADVIGEFLNLSFDSSGLGVRHQKANIRYCMNEGKVEDVRI